MDYIIQQNNLNVSKIVDAFSENLRKCTINGIPYIIGRGMMIDYKSPPLRDFWFDILTGRKLYI